jgi:CO/xanthine dehydrogenase FAD-binding subunit
VTDLDARRDESLVSVQDTFAIEFTIAENILNYAIRLGDAYLIGGVKELINAMRGVQEAVSLKVALNGLAVEDARKSEGEKKGD